MKRAKGDGVEIQLALWEGEGEDPIFCTHGLTANCRCWDSMVGALTAHYPLLAMDLRGRGLSSKPDTGYFVEQHVLDVRCVLEDLGLTRVHLMGHSLGAYVSLAFAARYPDQVKKLILVDAGGHMSQAHWDTIETAIRPSLARLGQIFLTFEDYTRPLKQAPFLQPWTPFLDTYFRYEMEAVEGGLRSRTQAAHITEEIAHIRQFDAFACYSRIACPVLILRATEGMVAEADLLLPQDMVEGMVQEIPHAQYVDIPGTNHYSIVFDQNEIRDRAILGFLAL